MGGRCGPWCCCMHAMTVVCCLMVAHVCIVSGDLTVCFEGVMLQCSCSLFGWVHPSCLEMRTASVGAGCCRLGCCKVQRSVCVVANACQAKTLTSWDVGVMYDGVLCVVQQQVEGRTAQGCWLLLSVAQNVQCLCISSSIDHAHAVQLLPGSSSHDCSCAIICH